MYIGIPTIFTTHYLSTFCINFELAYVMDYHIVWWPMT